MKPPEPAQLLRIYLSENDQWHHTPLYEALVKIARESGIAGATVLRGPLGYGRRSQLHTAKILRLADDLPVVIEIVETAPQIEAFLPKVEEMAPEALVTLEKIQILRPS
jgi:PII-like signaling protein